MQPQDMVLIYTTFPDKQSATKVAQKLVELKLAACANIFSGMSALYEWQGEMQSEEEVAVLFKTMGTCQDELSDRLVRLHPYDIRQLSYALNHQVSRKPICHGSKGRRKRISTSNVQQGSF